MADGDGPDQAEQPVGEVGAKFGRSLPVVWEGKLPLPDETPAADHSASGESEVTETIEQRKADRLIVTAPENALAEPASTPRHGEEDDPLPDTAMGEMAAVHEKGGPVAASPAGSGAEPMDTPAQTQEPVGEGSVDHVDVDSVDSVDSPVDKEGLKHG